MAEEDDSLFTKLAQSAQVNDQKATEMYENELKEDTSFNTVLNTADRAIFQEQNLDEHSDQYFDDDLKDGGSTDTIYTTECICGGAMKCLMPNNDTMCCYSCKQNTVKLFQCDEVSEYTMDTDERYKLNEIKHIQFCSCCWTQIHKLANTPNNKLVNFAGTKYLSSATLTAQSFDNKYNNFSSQSPLNNDSTKINSIKDLKPLWISPQETKDGICYIKLTINNMAIDETFETRNATCFVKLNMRIYWMFSSISDYQWYSKLQKHWMCSISDYQDYSRDSWVPEFNIKSSKCDIGSSELKCVDMNEFFTKETLLNMQGIDSFENKILYDSNAEKKVKHIYEKSYGLLWYCDYECELEIDEPFEVNSFPFDCQDVPIIIEPSNFKCFAPVPHGENKILITVLDTAIELGIFTTDSVLCEFNQIDNNVHLRVKLKRMWHTYLLKYVFLIFSAALLSLLVFSLTDDDKADRLSIVTGLVLTIIFIELPDIPGVTVLHEYYYGSFLFLVIIAIHCGVAEVFAETEIFLSVYSCIFLLYNLIFIAHSYRIMSKEQKKFTMTSEQIKKYVSNENMRLVSDGTETADDVFTTEMNVEKYTDDEYRANVSVITGIANIENIQGTSTTANQFVVAVTKTGTQPTTWHYSAATIFLMCFVLIQLVVTFTQFAISNEKISQNENIIMISLSIGQLMCLCMGGIGRLSKSDLQSLSSIVLLVMAVINYVLVIRRLVLLDDFTQWEKSINVLYFVWLITPLILYLLTVIPPRTTLIPGIYSMGARIIFSYIEGIVLAIYVCAVKWTTMIVQLKEVHSKNDYKQCIVNNRSDVFIDKYTTYLLVISTVTQLFIGQVIYWKFTSKSLSVILHRFEMICYNISLVIVIASCYFWFSNSNCFDKQKEMRILTLIWSVVDSVFQFTIWRPLSVQSMVFVNRDYSQIMYCF